MKTRNRVAWTEGMFLKTQHFQQADRWTEALVRERAAHIAPYPWGIVALRIDEAALGIGRIALSGLRCVLPDGTAINAPEDADLPPPLELEEGSEGRTIHLALPVRSPGTPEFTGPGGARSARYRREETDAPDANADTSFIEAIEIGRLALSLMPDGAEMEGMETMAVARVAEVRPDLAVVLDDSFVPPCLTLGASQRLSGSVTEIAGLVRHRAAAIAERATDPALRGAAEVGDYLMLQALNRAQPELDHLAAQAAQIHPERAWLALARLGAELRTFTDPGRRPAELPPYRHADPSETFRPVMDDLRRSLSSVLDRSAVRIPLEERRYGVRVGQIEDAALREGAAMVLAARSAMPPEQMRRYLPTQVKVGSVERISELVNAALPGVPVRPLAVAPRQLPYRAGYGLFRARHHPGRLARGRRVRNARPAFRRDHRRSRPGAVGDQGMSAEDPAEDGPRIVLPTPGRRAAPEPAVAPAAPEREAPRRPMAVADILDGFRLDGGEVPTVVSLAAPLLNLADILRTRENPPDLAGLRAQTMQAMQVYERGLANAGIPADQARVAHYILCATLDDVVRNRPWGEGWAVEGLVSTFHHDVTGGDKVYELIDLYQRTPGAHRDILLLAYFCLSLGFEGRMRVARSGSLELMTRRENLYRILRTQFGSPEQDLSPHWRGEDAAHSPGERRRGLLLLLGLLTFLLVGLFLALSWVLDRSTDRVIADMAALPPDEAPSLYVPPPPEPEPEVQPVETPAAPAPPAAEPEAPPPIEAFLAFLRPEVEQRLVRLYRSGDGVLVRIVDPGAFAPGSAEVAEDFRDTFQRIGQALAAEEFDVLVTGHTDADPVTSSRYGDNAALSLARANSVRDIVVSYTLEPERISVDGAGSGRPLISPEVTDEDKAANRRTEILVSQAGTAVDPALLSPPAGLEVRP